MCFYVVQVVQNYRRLLRMLDPENLPPDYTVPHWFAKFVCMTPRQVHVLVYHVVHVKDYPHIATLHRPPPDISLLRSAICNL